MVYELCVDLLGADGMLYSNNYPKIRPNCVGVGSPDPHKAFLRSRANSIEGGTSEVMRNILGERVLGLPGDVRTDKELPWKDVPRQPTELRRRFPGVPAPGLPVVGGGSISVGSSDDHAGVPR